MRRRLSALAAATLLTIGGLFLGTATPAVADPPTVNFTDLCGAVGFSWDTGTIGGDDGWQTTVLRNDIVIDEFSMQSRGSVQYGARDGDRIEIRREGLPASSYLHRTPEGCTDAPLLTVTPTSGCDGLTLSFGNEGTRPVSGIQVLAEGYEPWEVAPLAPGRTELELPLVDGDRFYVRGPLADGDWSIWLTGTHLRPTDCAADPSPGPSGEPSPSDDPGAGPTPSVTTPGAGGQLPITGAQTALISIAGLVLIGTGAALFVVARRHRVRFTTAERQ
ncbi:LPXTG-motif cell wall anchor domain-containing protein [Micromonospora phaseoli]|uniref:LPXTG-motif cell wall anchor domain-containing protein n=1 Tax=Micromonospora phaseoli TaxID=1144548 RepID=A0A1H7AA88_9ACTN|nr:LPXTG cell wall anchor domain-containing protein [Micromonospora phaseoli]PZV96493.1 LPXTG-motif cell wall-anchored protein [Micromonospora phaseoli]SEJ62549.1 LPXTG-motif cell wall anchor domain-containing protein [Micromonospora phaseoli]